MMAGKTRFSKSGYPKFGPGDGWQGEGTQSQHLAQSKWYDTGPCDDLLIPKFRIAYLGWGRIGECMLETQAVELLRTLTSSHLHRLIRYQALSDLSQVVRTDPWLIQSEGLLVGLLESDEGDIGVAPVLLFGE